MGMLFCSLEMVIFVDLAKPLILHSLKQPESIHYTNASERATNVGFLKAASQWMFL